MNSDSAFLEFANGLSNLEKSRNFNVFAGYSLEPFTKTLKSLILIREMNPLFVESQW